MVAKIESVNWYSTGRNESAVRALAVVLQAVAVVAVAVPEQLAAAQFA